MAASNSRVKSMDNPCCGEEWLGDVDNFVTKLLSKYACMRLK
jgi:hypothetical protein